MKRRKFIITGGISLAGLSLLSFPMTGYSSSEEKYPLLHEFLPEEVIQTIGIEYLKTNPDFDQKLVAALSQKQLAGLMKQDFEKENTTMVAGWILSLTEAQHCAISYLQNR